ncbi:MAG: outer membrane protein transport protein [Hydrogenophilus sp.]|nr:outer membrane protein transport protein [Hydrogenophilus sp.]
MKRGGGRWWIGGLMLVLPAAAAEATNGMNMEAFGAHAGGLGGASMAYDSGNSAVMNNPATLALRKPGNNFGLGVTHLGPDVVSYLDARQWEVPSGGTSYWMPSVSWIRTTGNGWSYGFGVLAQGGMGTEYEAGSFLSPSGLPVRSEVGFARAMVPLAKRINERLAVAGQIDFVWAGLDMQMDMTAPQMAAGMMTGRLRASGPMAAMLGGMPMNGYARFDVSDKSDWKQQTRGHGWAYKVGVHYRLSPEWAVGVAFHSKTRLQDFSGSGRLGMGAMGVAPMAISGRYTIDNFEWPTTWAVGVAYEPTSNWMVAADVKRLRWSDSMDVFRVRFSSSMGDLGVELDQKWRDQTVYMVGVEYRPRPGLALRAGLNYGRNPLRAEYLNPLFPATVERHWTVGVGMRVTPKDSIAAAVAFVPEVMQTIPAASAFGVPAVRVTHSQTTVRVNWNHQF